MQLVITIENAEVGDRVKFYGERLAYTIRARNNRFIICSKPFNIRRTILYTIIDLVRGVRGRDNLIFGRIGGYTTQQSFEDALAELDAGLMEVSRRRYVDLNIQRVFSK